MCLFRASPYCVRVCRIISREQALGYSPPPPSAPACWQAEKSQMTKSPPLAVKKVRLTPVQKMITIFSIGRCQTDGITQAIVFLPPTADFLNGHRPLFEPCRLLPSCEAWRWGMVATIRRKTRFPTGVTALPQKGEADNSCHGFLCLFQPITEVQIMDFPRN